ncbi:MAG: peptidoglycan DD-metalloendopeptidase family protein [Pelosinus sp.]|nr:peptidoglycan DD-metalloendopeptidase family protein [Pelosinus sp.]
MYNRTTSGVSYTLEATFKEKVLIAAKLFRGEDMKLSYGKVWRQARTVLVLAVPPIVLLLTYPLFLKFLPAVPLEEAESEVPPAIVETVTKPSKTSVPPIKKYLVQAGDTLSDIAVQHNVDVDTLLAANPEAEDIIRPGQQLLILSQKGALHTVAEGDTLSQIAQMYTVQVDAIMHANNKDSEFLAIGEKLFVPGGKRAKRSEAEVSRAKTGRMVWPTIGEISSPFGYRWGRIHTGIDIANDYGTSVRSALAGHVSYVGWVSGYGNTVMIEHGKGYVTLYGHLSQYSTFEGQYVQAGQTIAYMGSTGNSTGPHLHFEVRVNDQPINPLSILP